MEEDFDAQQTHEWATKAIRAQRLPLPARPKSKDPEFEFPTDPAAVNDVQLGQLMLRFTSWFTWAVRLLGIAESELTLVDTELRLKVNQHGLEVRETLGRVNADVVEAAVLKERPDLKSMNKRRAELTAVRIQLESRLKIYERGYQALSRELSRREMEARLQPRVT